MKYKEYIYKYITLSAEKLIWLSSINLDNSSLWVVSSASPPRPPIIRCCSSSTPVIRWSVLFDSCLQRCWPDLSSSYIFNFLRLRILFILSSLSKFFISLTGICVISWTKDFREYGQFIILFLHESHGPCFFIMSTILLLLLSNRKFGIKVPLQNFSANSNSQLIGFTSGIIWINIVMRISIQKMLRNCNQST